MPDVKIKGYSGAELEYQDVPKVYLAAPESTVENPVLVPFTYGEAIDGAELEPDFSEGDMQITVPDGYLLRSGVVKKPENLVAKNIKKGESVAGIVGEFEGNAVETESVTKTADFSAGNMIIQPSEGKNLKSVTVEKPRNLIPENVAEGVDVAGIIGTLIGGSNVKIQIINNVWYNGSKSYEHNLGAIPDVIIFFANDNSPTITSVRHLSAFGISEAMYNKYPTLPKKAVTLNTNANKPMAKIYEKTIEENDGNCIYSMTNNSFILSYALPGTILLISGLT